MELHLAEAARLMGLEVVEDDIDLINRISKTPLTESEVYTFSVRLCDNEVDRDYERFSVLTLEKLAKMFAGKPGIFDNQCSARIYRTELVRDAEKTTAAGDEYCCLKGWAYMLRNEQGKDVIAEIEAGIKKEVSMGCAVEQSVCSICGAGIGTCPHAKGKTYDGLLCFAELRNPTDVFEWSFVATPAKKKEEPMEKMDKPRICEVLGGEDNPLEVDEVWSVTGNDRAQYRITYDGNLEYRMPNYNRTGYGRWISTDIPTDFIAHPDRIIRKPRFTEEEVAKAAHLHGAWGENARLRRTSSNTLTLEQGEGLWLLPNEWFPSLRPGQATALSDITGECRHGTDRH